MLNLRHDVREPGACECTVGGGGGGGGLCFEQEIIILMARILKSVLHAVLCMVTVCALVEETTPFLP